MSERQSAWRPFDMQAPVIVAGAGACGLTAALAARDAGADVLVLERDVVPAGSTALTNGLIPAAGTRWQRATGIVDAAGGFAADIRRANHGEADPEVVAALAAQSAPTLEWLADAHAVPLVFAEEVVPTGHGVARMHAVPERTGTALMAALAWACERAEVEILTSAQVTELVATPHGRVRGIAFSRPDGRHESVGCDALVLATSGFAGNPELVRRYLPELADATYFGHDGNRGDALRWGHALGADLRDLSSYQAHAALALPHRIAIAWTVIAGGGIQVDAGGERFANEDLGCSEQCRAILRRPGREAWNVYDERLHRQAMASDDYRGAVDAGAVRTAATAAELAIACGLPADALTRTLDEVARLARGEGKDAHGRDFTSQPALAPPYYAVRVTGALLHTQGGLAVAADGRVLRTDGSPLPNLFAGGGAARGISGPRASGFLPGNGLLSAIVLGRLAGAAAAKLALG